MNLTTLTDEAVQAILALPENGKRSMHYGQSLLNKKGRSLRPIREKFHKGCEKLGLDIAASRVAWQHVADIATLEANAE